MITQITIITAGEEGAGYEWLAYNHANVIIAKSPTIYATVHDANQGAMTLKGECLYGGGIEIIDTTIPEPLQKNNEEARQRIHRVTERLFRPNKAGKVTDTLEGWGDR